MGNWINTCTRCGGYDCYTLWNSEINEHEWYCRKCDGEPNTPTVHVPPRVIPQRPQVNSIPSRIRNAVSRGISFARRLFRV